MTDTAADRRKGFLITFLGVMWLSPDALLLRLIDADAATILAYRGGLSALTLLLFLTWRDGKALVGKIRRGGRRLLIIAGMYALNTVTFVIAIGNASVADVLVILAATPLIAAAMAWMILKEKPRRNTAIAIALGALGVCISAIGGASAGSLLGIGASLATTTLLAGQFTAFRAWPEIDNVAAVFIGSIGVGILGWTFGAPLTLSGMPLMWAVFLGLFMTPIAFTLVTIGPRYLTSAEVSLMMLLETAFGPLWVWLALGEEPHATALLGGAIIVSAIVVASFTAFRRVS